MSAFDIANWIAMNPAPSVEPTLEAGKLEVTLPARNRQPVTHVAFLCFFFWFILDSDFGILIVFASITLLGLLLRLLIDRFVRPRVELTSQTLTVQRRLWGLPLGLKQAVSPQQVAAVRHRDTAIGRQLTLRDRDGRTLELVEVPYRVDNEVDSWLAALVEEWRGAAGQD